MEATLALIALSSTLAGCLIYVVHWATKELSSDLKEHTKAAQQQTLASEEVLRFMKNLNGKLEGAFVDKVREKRGR